MSDFTELKIIEIILVLNIKLWYIIAEPKLKQEHKMKFLIDSRKFTQGGKNIYLTVLGRKFVWNVSPTGVIFLTYLVK